MAGIEIREATEADDPVLIGHYLALWDSYGVPRHNLLPDPAAPVLTFIREGRAERELTAFIAYADGNAVASAACQVHLSPYPSVVRPELLRNGYIWSVFVEAEFRRRGIARLLVERAIEHLRRMECTRIVLHSSDAGEPLYRAMGFERAHEMRLDL